MKLGAEDKKKVAWLSGLFLVLACSIYYNFFAGSSPSPSPRPAATKAVAAPSSESSDTPARSAPRTSSRLHSDEFLPVLHSKRPEDQVDPNTVDPKIRFDLMAKLQEVPPAGSGRNLFIMGQPPAPPPRVPVGAEPTIKLGHGYIGPTPITIAGPPPPPPPPPLPPITFKYYGFSTVRKDGKKAAFFLMGDEIQIKAVGDMVDRVYRLVSIGLTSAVVEDTQSKRTQTVPLAEEAQV